VARGALVLAATLGVALGAFRLLGSARGPAPATSAASAAAPRTVRLVLIPPDVSAEVDGVPAAPRDGVVEIHGAPGSKHNVRISKGALEAREEIVITEGGAMPPKLELVRGAGGSSAAPGAQGPSGPAPRPP
jgi:serine/threonine-protein kinase